MRDNGLTAAAYTSLGGIDPLVAEPVLSALAEAGIAAYSAMPGESSSAADTAGGPVEVDGSAGELGDRADAPVKAERSEAEDDDTALPAPAEAGTQAEPAATADAAPAKAEGRARAEARARVPAGFEEIFVDSDAVDRAHPVIERSTEDAEWKSLIEQFNAPSAPGHDGGDSPVPRWPASEEVDDKYEPLIDVPAAMAIEDKSDDDEDDKPAKKTDDPHDHYVPPEPPRGPRLDWISRIAWLGLIGGPLLLIAAALLDFGTGRITTLAVVGFIGGFLTLVIRMKDRLPPDDTPDDGAVV
jgi:hypothetical protein